MNVLPKIKRDEKEDDEQLKKSMDVINLNKQKLAYDYFSSKFQKNIIDSFIKNERDERFIYFIKYGTLRRYEGDGEIIFVEIPQIPKKIVVYRRPIARQKNQDRLHLNNLELPHIPLFEGEENLKLLSLENNNISKIDHLVSLNNLLYLNLYSNKIIDIENLQNITRLRALMLGKNLIEKIKNLHYLPDLEVLDLHSNKIKIIENLSFLKKLRLLNIANNQISNFNDLIQNRNLEELNLRKNLIVGIPFQINSFDKLRKLNLGRNMISKIEPLIELKKLKHLNELIIEDNPVLILREANEILKLLPIKIKNRDSMKKTEGHFGDNNISQSISVTTLQKDKDSTNSLNIVKKDDTLKSERPQIIKDNNSNSQITSFSIETNDKLHKIEENSNAIIEQIEKEWNLEFQFIKKNGYNGYNVDKLKETEIVTGHAELEGPFKLNIYGNALEVLDQREFYDKISEINFEYFNFDLISKKRYINKLKNYQHLHKIGFSNNNLYSFYQIIKFEDFSKITSITIKNNEVTGSNLLKYFCIYRFQNLKIFNQTEIVARDLMIAKTFFEYFDKCISINENQKEEKMRKTINKKPEQTGFQIDQIVLKDSLCEFYFDNLLECIDEIIESEDTTVKN